MLGFFSPMLCNCLADYITAAYAVARPGSANISTVEAEGCLLKSVGRRVLKMPGVNPGVP